VKWRRSSVAISSIPGRSAIAMTVASVVPRGKSAYWMTSSAARRRSAAVRSAGSKVPSAMDSKKAASTRLSPYRSTRYPTSAITVGGTRIARPASRRPANKSTHSRWCSPVLIAAATNGPVSQRITVSARNPLQGFFDSLRYVGVVGSDGAEPRRRPRRVHSTAGRQPRDFCYCPADLRFRQGVDQSTKLVPCRRHTADDTYRRRWLRNVSCADVDNSLGRHINLAFLEGADRRSGSRVVSGRKVPG